MHKRILSLAVIAAMLVGMMFTSTAAVKDVKKELNAMTAKKNQAKKNLLNDKKIRASIIADLEKKGYEKAQIEARITDIEAAIHTLDGALLQAQSEYDAQLKLFQDRMIAVYIHSKTNAEIGEILKSTTFEELFKTRQILKLISRFDQNLMASLDEKQAEINELKLQREQEEDNAQEELEASLSRINELKVSRSEAEDRVERSQKNLVLIEKAEDKLEKEAKELGDLVNKVASKGKYTGGIMQWPAPGYYGISSPFGYRIHPILKYKKFHGGIDINAPFDSTIRAAANGTVISSGWRSGGSGYTVIIDHGGGITTFYLHIREGGILVKAGQTVKAGDAIAKVGSTGLSTGPHLHFEVRKNGVRQNPLDYVTGK